MASNPRPSTHNRGAPPSASVPASTAAPASASAPHQESAASAASVPPQTAVAPHTPDPTASAVPAPVPPVIQQAAVPTAPVPAVPVLPVPAQQSQPPPGAPHLPHPPPLPTHAPLAQAAAMINSPISPRRGAGAGRFTPSGVVDQAHESEWAHRLASLDWDETSIVFTKRQLVDFLRYLGVHVDPGCENIAGLPRYAVFGKITSSPAPVLSGQPTPAHSGPSTPTIADAPHPAHPQPIPVLAGGFRPTHRARTSRSSLPGTSPQTAGLFGPGDDLPDQPASPPPLERVVREAVRPSPPAPSYPPPDTAQPESSDEEYTPPTLSHTPTYHSLSHLSMAHSHSSHSHSHGHSPMATPPATPSRSQTYRSRQSSGGLSSAPVMFPIENVQHTSTGYPTAPSSSTTSTASTSSSHQVSRTGAGPLPGSSSSSREREDPHAAFGGGGPSGVSGSRPAGGGRGY